MYITKKHMSRRTVLKGMGVTVALPLLDAMVPARTALAKTLAAPSSSRRRLVCMEMVHGSAGSTAFGVKKNLFAPVRAGRDFEWSPTLEPLAPFREYVTVVSNTDVHNAEAFTLPEIGGDHFRSSAVFLTQSHPKQTEGNDVHAGTSLDQLYAKQFGQDTPIPSMQLSIENVDQAGGRTYGYSCIYTDTISWASPTQPLPMVRDPRVVFDQLFGVGATAEERAANLRADESVVDWVTAQISQLRKEIGATDKARLNEYRRLLANPQGSVAVSDERVGVKAVPATADEITLVSDLFRRKYANDQHMLAIQRPEVVPATFQLVPGEV